MCGIAGFVGRESPEGLGRMTAALHHRGPDDRGTRTFRGPAGWTGLGSTRLAILDLSDAGRMPMSTGDGRYTIVYNGELYNCRELRGTLAGRGHRFRSSGDTEVVLNAFREWGPACLDRFNGMYAIAIWDRSEHTLFLARDHLGIKPLYLVHLGKGLAFASEVKALLELPEVTAEVDHESLGQYLTFLWVPEPRTLFRGIRKLPAGHYHLHGFAGSERRRYWDLSFPPASSPPPETAPRELQAEVKARFEAAVGAQMLSDAPIGAFLSAGLDSSCIVAAMAARGSAPVRTFTITVPPGQRSGAYAFDDPAVARRSADRFGCAHHEVILEPRVAELLPHLVWHMDEPVADPAVIAAHLVSEAASSEVKVLLSGVGGDELFGGYRKYRAHYMATAYRRLPGILRSHVIEPLAARLPTLSGSRAGPAVRLLKKMARSASLPPVDRFLMDGTYLTEKEKAGLLADRLGREVEGRDPPSAHLDAFRRVHGADFLNQMLYVDMMTFMPSLNLLYNDKMSMAASVEVRVPYLDRELVEWVAANVSPRLKIRGRTTKYVLREAMANVVGKEVLAQRKTGFGAPADVWLREDLAEMLRDLLSAERLRRRGVFRPEAVHDMISQHANGRGEWSFQLWQLLTFELWADRFQVGS